MPVSDPIIVKERPMETTTVGSRGSFAPSEHLLDLTHLRPKVEGTQTNGPKLNGKPSVWFKLRAAVAPHPETHSTLSPRPKGHAAKLLVEQSMPPVQRRQIPMMGVGPAINAGAMIKTMPMVGGEVGKWESGKVRSEEVVGVDLLPVVWSFGLPLTWQRKMGTFAVAAMLVVVPFFGRDVLAMLGQWRAGVSADAEAGIALIKAAGVDAANNDFVRARLALDGAVTQFMAAEQGLGAIGRAAAKVAGVVAPTHPAASATAALTAASELARAGSEISVAFAGLGGDGTPTDKLDEIEDRLDAARPHLLAGLVALAKVHPEAVPEEQRESVVVAQQVLPTITSAIDQTKSWFGLLRAMLGAERGRRYLVLFQNNAELRPTGGFIGSFALVDIDRGEIKNVTIPGGGSYDLQGSLSLNVAAPQPLRLINPKWEFQDANWSPDFPTSAAMAQEFYEKAGGPTTDGVIAITTTVLEKLLAITGPIAMPEYNKTITSENFRMEAQKAVELEYDRVENKPKQFIADLAPKVLAKLGEADPKQLPEVAAILGSALTERDVQVWLADEDEQAQVTKLGWAGGMTTQGGVAGDYLAIVHANVAGQKTDLVMRNDVQHEVQVLPDGSAIATVTMRRTHTGEKGAIFTGVRNVDFVRVYVPKGSTIVEAKGFTTPAATMFAPTVLGASTDRELALTESTMRTDEASGTQMYEELDRTVFGNWMMTDPGETTEASITYSLPAGTVRVRQGEVSLVERVKALMMGATIPAPETISYDLTVRRQAGINGGFSSKVTLPRGSQAAAAVGYSKTETDELVADFSTLRGDATLGVVAELR